MTDSDIQYQSQKRFKTGDADSYDSVVDHFDKYTRRYSAHLPGPILKMADVPAGGTVLDVGTGTGIIPVAGAGGVGRGLRFVGIDLSDGMLGKARANALADGLQSRLEFQKMDAENLGFSEAEFDAAVSLYALHHFPDPQKAVNEMFRVLKPGAKVVIAVGSAPDLVSVDGVRAAFRRAGSTWRNLRGRELAACGFIDSLVELHIPRDKSTEVTEWAEKHQAFRGSVKSLLITAGFTAIKTNWKGQYSTIFSPDDFWLLQMTFSSVARKRIQRADDAVVKDLKAVFYRQCEQVLNKGGRLVYQTGAVIVSGLKPE